MKHALTDLVEAIPHSSLRKLTARALEIAPAAFWTAPASTSGKYHPAASLGKGGLVRHTRAVHALVLDLLAMYGVEPHAPLYSVCCAAALLHDAWKVSEDSEHSHFDHPLRAGRAILPLLEQYSGIPPHSGAQLLEAIESHMGRWNTSKHAPGITLPRPLSEAAWIVHTADFIASRKHVSIEQK